MFCSSNSSFDPTVKSHLLRAPCFKLGFSTWSVTSPFSGASLINGVENHKKGCHLAVDYSLLCQSLEPPCAIIFILFVYVLTDGGSSQS